MAEVSICGACVQALYYNGQEWVPFSKGFTRIDIYKDSASFRLVGIKLEDMSIVINTALNSTIQFRVAAESFHQMSDGRSVFGFQYTSVEEANAVAEGFKKALAPVQASQPLQSQPQQAHQQSQPQQTQVQHQPSGPVAPAAPAPSAPSAPSAPLAPSAPAAPSAPSAPVAPSASMSPPSGPPAPPSEPPSAPESDAGTSSLASALLNPDAPPPAAAAVKPPSPSKSEITKEKAEPKGASAPASIPNHSSQNPGIQPAQKSFDVGDMVKEMAAKKLNAQHALPAKSSINNNLNRVSSSTDNLSDNQMVLLKQEILKEIRKDLEEMKQEILAAIKSH